MARIKQWETHPALLTPQPLLLEVGHLDQTMRQKQSPYNQ
jgi:hypothetical protein